MVALAATPRSWRPLIVISITQILLAFNVTALKVSIDAIVFTHQTSPSAVKNAIIVYSLVVASGVLVGAKVAKHCGARRVFRITIALYGAAMFAMIVGTGARTMIVAQAAAGAAAAVLGPTAIVLAAHHYADVRAKVAGWLTSVRSASLICAFLIAGAFATWIDWRLTYVLLFVLAAIALKLSDAILESEARFDLRSLAIDKVGLVLIVAALWLIGIGSENLVDWGVLFAKQQAPFGVLMLSPAPVAIGLGVLLVKAFAVWSRVQRMAGRPSLISPELFGEPSERAALFSIFTIAAVGSAVTFLIPLYIEIVQGRNSVYTALALVPYTSAAFAAALLGARMYGHVPTRRAARVSFLGLAIGLALLAAVIRNEWSDWTVVMSLAIVGASEGTLMTLLFKMLVSAVRGDSAADVDPLCTATTHVAIGVGTALAGALAVGLLSASVHSGLRSDPAFAETLRAHVNLDSVAFVSNDRLREVLERTDASAEHVEAALRINTQARLRALKQSFFALSALALIAVIPYVRTRRGNPGKRWHDEVKGSSAREQPFSVPPMTP